jgi:hypothetical protein
LAEEAAQKLELEVRHTNEKREAKMRIAMQRSRDILVPDETDQLSQDPRIEHFDTQIQINQTISLQTVNLFHPQPSIVNC